MTLNVAFGVKQLQFSWTAASGATSYRLLEDSDGVSGFTAVGNVLPAGSTSTVREIAVHRHNWAAARYALDACNAAGCSRSAAVTTTQGMLSSIGFVKASNTGTDDRFGFGLGLSADGNTLAVGASLEDSNATGVGGDQNSDAAIDSGAVYVFTRSNGTWSQQAYVKASNAAGGDRFGSSVALSGDGNTLAVAAVDEGSDATGVGGDQSNDAAVESGAVYVFTRASGTWSQQAYVKASNTEAGDFFGNEVTLSADGNTLAVAALAESSNATGVGGDQGNNLANDSGAVYVFTRSSGVWSQQAYVKASNTQSGDLFGSSVRLSGDGHTLAVGASQEGSNATGVDGDQSNNLAAFSGAVYVFTRAGAAWSQQAYVKASNTAASDSFGYSVALSDDGNTLAASARTEDSGATGIDGDQGNDLAGSSGAVYVFTRTGTAWSQQAYVKASNTEANDRFGWAVALSGDGNLLAVGAVGESSNATGIGGDQTNNLAPNAGAAYVYRRAGGVWSQHAYVKAVNAEAGDFANRRVALSGDGNTLATSADTEDSNAIGIGGDQTNNLAANSGAVYLH